MRSQLTRPPVPNSVPFFLTHNSVPNSVRSPFSRSAALRYRITALKADWLVYVIDAGQSMHMDLVFGGGVRAGWFAPAPGSNAAARGVAEKMGTAPSAPLVRVDHVGFGVVQGEDRKKFKTRDGSTVRLVDVLDEAKARAKAILAERLATQAASATASGPAPGGAGAPSEEELEQTAGEWLVGSVLRVS